jgi:hypothetical protein
MYFIQQKTQCNTWKEEINKNEWKERDKERGGVTGDAK